jgi:Ca2+/Na+ antiporter
VTEQVAEHTNQTIGALLNATFGNAPELLIATSALRSGLYRVVQLAMLGSMLSNLLFVFGLACLIGGIRWQVQELRITSGNVNVGLLLLSAAGSLLPAALILGNQIQGTTSDTDNSCTDVPTNEELKLSRVNAFILIVTYCCYLVFQLGTHKEEFDDDDNTVETPSRNHSNLSPKKNEKRNLFCLGLWSCIRGNGYEIQENGTLGDLELSDQNLVRQKDRKASKPDIFQDERSINSHNSNDSTGNNLLPHNAPARDSSYANGYFDDYENGSSGSPGAKPILPLGLADPAEETSRKFAIYF